MSDDANGCRRAPTGKFRVVSYDLFDYSDHVVGDFTTRDEALAVAREHAAVPNAIPAENSNHYFVYDDAGNCLDRVR